MVTRNDVKNTAEALGIKKGDTVLIHSSFKSFGPIENGAEDVVGGFFDAIGEEGTLVFPTLCQKDWDHIYANWHLDAPSDIGYLTNYFRKLPGARRSDQATHSVAAIGKYRDYITETHGQTGERYGIFGNTPFSADSPWEKMLTLDTKVVLIGCTLDKCTFRHLSQYRFAEKCLKKLEGHEKYEQMKERVWHYNKEGVWFPIEVGYVYNEMVAKNLISYTKCGDANIMSFPAKEFVEICDASIEANSRKSERAKDWLAEMDECIKK